MKSKETPASPLSTNGSTSKTNQAPGSARSWKTKTAADQRANKLKVALIALDVDRQALAQAPQFTKVLEVAKGGLPVVLEAMRLSTHPTICLFVEKYDSLSEHYRKILPWEAIAIMAGVDIPKLLGATILALREHGANMVKVIAITNHPDTVLARVRQAKKPSGVRDRNALDTALGFLPRPKNTNIIIPPARHTPDPADATEIPVNSEIDPDDIDMDDLFPDLTETQKLLSD